jgi:hypothetical protein
MGSIIDYIACPNCKTEAYRDFYYKTGEEYINCNNCGYHYSVTIKNRNKKLSELTETDWEVTELKTPYGAFRYKMAGDSFASCGSLATAEDADKFRVEMKLEYQGHVEFAQISRLDANSIVVEDVL